MEFNLFHPFPHPYPRKIRLLRRGRDPRDACGQERLRIAFQIAEEHVATGGTYAQAETSIDRSTTHRDLHGTTWNGSVSTDGLR